MIRTLDAAAPSPRPPRPNLRQAPIQARLAIWLLWLSLFLGVATYLAESVLQPIAIQPIPGLVSGGLAQAASLIAMAVPMIFFLFDAFTIFHVSRGRNWARILRLLLTAANVAAELRYPSPPGSTLVQITEEVGLALNVVALAFLFLTPGRLWFSRTTTLPAA